MSKLFFTKEERLTLEINILKENNLQMQINTLHNERQGLVSAFCNKNSQKVENIVNVNLQEGSIEFKDEEKKKREKK